jgi:HSP20 family molecular chaperone IbpA
MAKIEQSIEVDVPVTKLYQQMMQFQDYPKFMDSVREVRQKGDAHLQWRGEKGGKETEWESEITEQIPDKVIAWRNTSGPKNIGRATFQVVSDDKSRITLSVDSDEPASGEVGKAAKQRLERDLQRFKEVLEAEVGAAGNVRHRAAGTDADTLSDNLGRNGGSTHESGYASAQAGSKTFKQQPDQSYFRSEEKMAQQSGSMQFSGESGQSRSQTTQQGSNAMAQLWAQPARMMSQITNTFGEMPARMMEQEASMLQRSFVSPQAWLPTVIDAWEEPFVMMRKISEEMDQFFGKVMQHPMSKISQNGKSVSIVSRKWTPTIEVSQRGNEMLICADLPGLTKADVQLKVHDDKLTIEGERCEDGSSQYAQGYHRTERSYGRFYRAIPLPQGVDGHQAQAKMRDGVLEITVPMRGQQQHGARLEIQEADEGDLREQQATRQQNEVHAQQRDLQQTPQSQQRDLHQNEQHDGQQRQSGTSVRARVDV